MQIMRRNAYLKIGGFCIKLKFSSLNSHPSNKDFVILLTRYLGGFVLKHKPRIVDFTISFGESNHFYILHKKNMKFIAYFIRLKKKEIATFYYIGLRQFETILSMVLNELLRDSGFILHASAVSEDGRAFLFTGKSGAGKSTIMKLLSKKYNPIADDSIIIKKEGGRFYAYQTPFTEKEKWIKRGLKQYEIEKIFFLKKSNRVKIEEANGQRYVVNIMLKQLLTEREYLAKQTKIVFDFLSRNSTLYFLWFPKNKKTVDAFSKFSNKTQRHNLMGHHSQRMFHTARNI